jgi:hypothetical protein
MFNLPNPIPVFSQEPYFVSSDSYEESWQNRRTMYGCLLMGGLGGVVYEAMGQTRAVREITTMPRTTHGVFPLMWESVLWQNANQAIHARTFMLTNGAKYQDLVPHKEYLSPAWNSTDNWAYCMLTDDKKLFKIFFEKDIKDNVSGALPNTVYNAQWFNPRTGEWINAGLNGTLKSDAYGIVIIPSPPTSSEDWGLSLFSK